MTLTSLLIDKATLYLKCDTRNGSCDLEIYTDSILQLAPYRPSRIFIKINTLRKMFSVHYRKIHRYISERYNK